MSAGGDDNNPLEELTAAEQVAAQQPIGLSDDFIREIAGLLDHDYTDRIQELCRDLPAPDAAELIVKLDGHRSRKLIEVLEDDLHPETFSYLDRPLLNDLLDRMSGKNIAAIVNELDSDDAIDLITSLDEERQGNILRHLSRNLRAAVEEGLTFPEKSAGRMMQREFVAVPQFWTVGKTVDYLRAAAATLPERFYSIFIVDPMHRFVGAVSLSQTLCAQRAVKIDTLVDDEHVRVPALMDRESVAQLFRRKDLLSAPVVDEDDQLIGVITIDDVVDVIDEAAEEDILKLGGVAQSDINFSAARTIRGRFPWLSGDLLTQFITAFVISIFEGTIEQIVALAVLMPIVANMGGNGGIQTMAIVIRGLATKELSSANVWRVTRKELAVGFINGVLLGLLVAGATIVIYNDPRLAFVIGTAMAVNLTVASLAGIGIPVLLHKAGVDPAASATVFLTTVTDVIGFITFLGLATWILL